MKEYPVLSNDEMARAIRNGRKTQMRCPVKGVPEGATEVRAEVSNGKLIATYRAFSDGGSARWGIGESPFGGPGDRLWVRECWAYVNDYNGHRVLDGHTVLYRSDGDIEPNRWRPSSNMPRWACRTILEVVDVWVERVQDIDPADAIDEGGSRDARPNNNPWIWVAAFRRVTE